MGTGDDTLAVAFKRSAPQLLAYLRRRLPNGEGADDLLQTVFVKALAARRRGQKFQNVEAWLATATRNALADHYRASRPQFEELPDDLAQEVCEALDTHAALARCLDGFISELPSKYRQTLERTAYGRSSQSQEARQQGLTVSAIKTRAQRGRHLLLQSIQECCDVEFESGLAQEVTCRPGRECRVC